MTCPNRQCTGTATTLLGEPLTEAKTGLSLSFPPLAHTTWHLVGYRSVNLAEAGEPLPLTKEQQDDVDMLHSNLVERHATGDVILFGIYICCDKNPCEHESKKERQCERSSS